MKAIIRLLTSLVVAIIVSILVFSIGLAATGYVSEQSSDFTGSGLNAANGCSSSTCQNSNAKYTNQSNNYNNDTASGNWYTGKDNVDQWKTYIPNLSGDWAGVKYYIGNSTPPHEVYETTVNQNNWKGSYVNVGTFSYNSTWAQMRLGNRCIYGYMCDGRRLYFDKSKYIY